MTSEKYNVSRLLRPKISIGIWFWTTFMMCLLSCSYAAWFHYWNIFRLIQYPKCPACYGDNLCTILEEEPDLLKVNHLGYFGWIVNSITSKNVYQGSLNSTHVMIKRLSTETELYEMDQLLCTKVPEFCQHEVQLSDKLYDTIMADIHSLLSSRLMNEQKVNLLRFCPSFENLPTLFKNIENSIQNDQMPMTLSKLVPIWTILHVNPEPLILQIFPKEEGWPFPQYLGACGRVIFETFEGIPLLDFYSKPWEERARLSLQLLHAADKFITYSPDFSLYLLDYSPDNIAVDTNNQISFIDLEHTIIVDKHASLFDKEQNELHHCGALCKEEDCSYFSPDDICEHQISDFNHFILCKEVLAPSKDPYVAMPQGLLHSPPLYVRQQYPFLESALFNCSSDSNLNHIIPARVLRDILQEIEGQSL